MANDQLPTRLAAFEHLAPANRIRVCQLAEELHGSIPEQSTAREDVIREYAIAKWRSELC